MNNFKIQDAPSSTNDSWTLHGLPCNCQFGPVHTDCKFARKLAMQIMAPFTNSDSCAHCLRGTRQPHSLLLLWRLQKDCCERRTMRGHLGRMEWMHCQLHGPEDEKCQLGSANQDSQSSCRLRGERDLKDSMQLIWLIPSPFQTKGGCDGLTNVEDKIYCNLHSCSVYKPEESTTTTMTTWWARLAECSLRRMISNGGWCDNDVDDDCFSHFHHNCELLL
jgi:hypothetical protein